MKKALLVISIITSCLHAQNPSLKWVGQIGGNKNVSGYSIVTDKNKQVYFAGSFQGAVDFDQSAGVLNLSSSATAGYYDGFICKVDSMGSLIWAKNIGGGSAETGIKTIKVDSIGNVYVSGFFEGSVDFDPGPGTFNIASLGYRDVFIAKLDNNGNLIWAKSIGAGSYDEASSMAISNNNIYMTGHFSGTVDFDPGITSYTVSSVSSADIFINKLDNNGDFVWVKQIGGNNSNVSNSIAVDASENIYIAGYFSGTVDFDPGSATYSLSSASANSDIFINKFDANGSLIWAKKMGSTYSDGACAVAVDLGGNIFTTGYFGTGCDFDPNAGFAYKNTYGTGDLDVFINKLDPSGNHIWTKQMGGTSNDYPDNIALDGTGNVYISGRFEGVGYFNPSALTYTIASSGPGDFFFSKFDANGNFVWANAMGCNLSSLEQANSIAVNNAGDFFATGQFSGTTDFDPSSAIFSLTVPSPASYNCFVLQMNQCLTPPAAPLNTTPASSLHICSGTSASFSATSNGTIKWYATPTSTLVLSTGQLYVAMLTAGIHIYYAEAVTCTVSASRTAITVTVDPTCADVWPGDANSDGTADNLDVLELGLHYSQTGPARATTSNSWQSCFSNNWSGTITNGKNLNHSDCNGDGVIDDNDTLAVYNNYGLAHSFKPNQQTVTNPQLSIVPDQAAVVKGNWGSASIYLGDSGSPISGINGIAFTVNFDNALIEANSVWIEYPSSFINASNQNLNFRKLDFAANNLYTATTHTITNNVSGNGLIATLHYQIKSSLATDEVLNLGIVQGYKSDGLGAIMPLTAGTGTLMAMGASVGLNEVAAGNRIGISPNPAQSSVLISSTSDLEKVEVLNLTGQVLISELAGEKAHHLNIEPLANGVYFIKVYNSSKQFMLKKLVIQK